MHIIIRATGLHFCSILQLQLTHRCKIRDNYYNVNTGAEGCNLRIGVKYEEKPQRPDCYPEGCNLRIGVKYEVYKFDSSVDPSGCNLRIGVKYEIVSYFCEQPMFVATYA